MTLLASEEAKAKLRSMIDPYEVVHETPPEVSGIAETKRDSCIDVIDFINEPETEYDWLVPGLLERGDRVGITAVEGAGKSTLLRQFGVQCASGIHPFTLEEIDPIRVLLLDFENSPREVRRKLKPLVVQAGERLKHGYMSVKCKQEGIDLCSTKEDRVWLEDKIATEQAELVLMGPTYKMANGDPNEEKNAKPVVQAIDQLRAKYQFALMLEMHVGHGEGGKRPTRPIGASLWLRWPEFGLNLSPKGAITHWRGQRDQRDWPVALKRGGEWPWTEEVDRNSSTFAQMMELVQSLGKVPNYREMAVELSCTKIQIQRAIKANRNQWDQLTKELKNANED